MGSIANAITQPLGVRIFPGGPYADRGLGDKALQASQPLQQTGQNLLTSGSQALPDLFGQLGATAGVGSPFATGSSKTDAWGQPVGGAQSYSLAPVFQSQYNALAAPINAARKQALQAAKGGLSARGLGKSGAHALEQQINAYADQDLSSALNQIMQAQQAQKLAALQQMIQGAFSEIGTGGNLIGQNVATTENQAQAAQQRTNQANADLFSAIGAGITGAQALGKSPTPQPNYGFPTPGGYNPAAGGIDPFSGLPLTYGPAAPTTVNPSTGMNTAGMSNEDMYNMFGAF